MIDIGDIHLADLNEEHRRLVVVVSTNQFHQGSGRALVAPQGLGPIPSS
jgi:mRNA-degrading endonuclease toxin of MazEF toxin-antitoxin module